MNSEENKTGTVAKVQFVKKNPKITEGVVVACGDIHGRLGTLNIALRQANRMRKALTPDGEKPSRMHFIILGDVGLGFPDDPDGSRRVTKMERMGKIYNATLYLLRGNHDNPAVWDSAIATRHASKQNHPHVVFLQDGLMTIKDHKYFLLGGGVSVDKASRTAGVTWWPGETVAPKLTEACIRKDVYGILSHTGPRPSTIPYTLPSYWAAAQHDVDVEQNVLKVVGNAIMPKRWVYGHYHTFAVMDNVYGYNTTSYDESKGTAVTSRKERKCECTCLDIGMIIVLAFDKWQTKNDHTENCPQER